MTFLHTQKLYDFCLNFQLFVLTVFREGDDFQDLAVSREYLKQE